MKRATKEKEDPIEKLRDGLKEAKQDARTGRRYGRRLVRVLKEKKGEK